MADAPGTPPDEMDLQFNDKPVCPYCGRQETDAWEYGCERDFQVDCACGQTYGCTPEVSVTYSSYKLKPKEPPCATETTSST